MLYQGRQGIVGHDERGFGFVVGLDFGVGVGEIGFTFLQLLGRCSSHGELGLLLHSNDDFK